MNRTLQQLLNEVVNTKVVRPIKMSSYTDSDLSAAEEIGLPDSRNCEDEITPASDGNGRAFNSPYIGNGATGKRGLPKLREILRRQKPDSEVNFFTSSKHI